ncbi:hypothetical protein [Glutamicibacter protophormiae]|uniref:hypothetical protein n=1 Tax=Glutamicibacter protophormiae TaxID=37930 RepID=UPI001984A7B7|nr:hypothetical protein [Glutamicibacter protophormiae]GGM01835.1 hypothetical protein GCM10010038_34950 [Glutamicibacter protophormiae]
MSSATLFSAGCSVIEDSAGSAASQLTDAASKEIVRQACAPIQDGRIDASELRVLSSLVGAVEGGGLPQDLVDVLNDLAESGDTVSTRLQERLVQACDDATAQAS